MPEPSRATILVVDDREENRYIVSRTLRAAGYSVVEARTGQEALTKAADLPDLLLLDIRLPDMTGYEVCNRIKANPSLARDSGSPPVGILRYQREQSHVAGRRRRCLPDAAG